MVLCDEVFDLFVWIVVWVCIEVCVYVGFQCVGVLCVGVSFEFCFFDVCVELVGDVVVVCYCMGFCE